MSSNNLLRKQDLVENPTSRVPICLCLDTSGSMGAVQGDCVDTGKTFFEDGRQWNLVTGGTSRLDELQKGVELFYDSLREDEVARYAAEICIVTFDSEARCRMDFANLDRQTDLPKLEAAGDTAMGEGVNLALDLLENRKQEYRDKGVDYFQPWLVLMTDGVPNGNEAEFERAAQRCRDLEAQKKLTVFPIAIGDEGDRTALAKFSGKRTPLKLQGLKFREFFAWLSQSVSRASQSTTDETIKLDINSIQGWAEL